MEAIFQWCTDNPIAVKIIGVAILLGLGFASKKLVMAGFKTSQFIRKVFSKKVEDGFENAVGSFYKGLRSDNTEEEKLSDKLSDKL